MSLWVQMVTRLLLLGGLTTVLADHLDLHNRLTLIEKRAIFGSEAFVPKYEVVKPVEKTVRRRKRSGARSNHVDDELSLTIATKEKTYHLKLQPQRNIVSPYFKLVLESEKGSIEKSVSPPECLFQGVDYSDGENVAAFSKCSEHGLTGLIITPNANLVLHHLPKRLRYTRSAEQVEQEPLHILFKREVPNFCGVEANSTSRYDEISKQKRSILNDTGPRYPLDARQLNRIKRQAKTSSAVLTHNGRNRIQSKQHLNKTIETAVFVDDLMYANMAAEHPKSPEKAVLNMVFTMINAVQLIYNQPSLAVKFSIVLVKIHILQSSRTGPSKSGGNINHYLKEFCKWQMARNPADDLRNPNHWDHALMLTGLDLYMNLPQNTVVIGLAWVSGMCHREYSCSLNEGASFESVFVISHELGHNLGMQHDGEDNNCSSSEYLMSASLGPGKTTWSSCSSDYVKKFLTTSLAGCLNDGAVAVASLNHQSPSLPGERYPASVQCKLAYGDKYRPYTTEDKPFDDVCRELWCANGTLARRAHPAMDGTECSPGKVCLYGDCVSRRKLPSPPGEVASIARGKGERAYGPNEMDAELSGGKPTTQPSPKWERRSGEDRSTADVLQNLLRRIGERVWNFMGRLLGGDKTSRSVNENHTEIAIALPLLSATTDSPLNVTDVPDFSPVLAEDIVTDKSIRLIDIRKGKTKNMT